MPFFESVQAIFTLDAGFFIDIILGNIFWVFAFYVMIYYFFEGKKTLYFFILFAFTLWAILDWEVLTGMGMTGASFLMFYYVTKLALLKLAETIPALKNYMIVLSSLQAYTLIWAFVFLVGGG